MGKVGSASRRSGIAPLAWIIPPLVVLLTLTFLIGRTWPLEIAYRLLTGWIRHPIANFTALNWNPVSIALCFCALAIGALLLQRFLRQSFGERWTDIRTVKSCGIFLLATAAAVAMTGIVHELAWLARSPIIQSNRGTDRTMAINNAKQIGLALIEMDLDGISPTSVDEIAEWLIKNDHNPDILFYSHRGRRGSDQFVLLQPGKPVFSGPPNTPILAAFGFSRNRCVVLRADNSAKVMTMEQLEAALDPQPEVE